MGQRIAGRHDNRAQSKVRPIAPSGCVKPTFSSPFGEQNLGSETKNPCDPRQRATTPWAWLLLDLSRHEDESAPADSRPKFGGRPALRRAFENATGTCGR